MSSGLIQRKWAIALLILSLLLALLLLHSPSHQGEWQSGQDRLPEVTLTEDRLTVQHLRDFRYHADGRIREARYLEQSFPLHDLQQIWFGISHFADNGLAHTFLSFEFAGEQYLIASVEARMRPEQEYHPLRGLLRQFHKIIVLGTEADIIGLRSHVRGERVLLYPLALTAEQRQHVLQGMMTDVAQLRQQAEFYNTLLDNCTTSLLRHDPQHRLWSGLVDYRILLPGHADAYAMERGWLTQSLPLTQQRSEARIAAEISPDSANFSRQIRLPNYQQLSLSLLVMQQERFEGRAIRTHGVVRGFDEPLHYWIEDAQLKRVALHPAEAAEPFLGQQVEVRGRFHFRHDEGRQLELDQITPSP